MVRHAIETIMDKWDIRFLALAQHIAAWSKDPSTKCGAVIVDEQRRVVGLGYNGFPRGMPDKGYKDRDHKLKFVVHAEANAILNAVAKVQGCTLYVWPIPACNECAKLIVQAGIERVVSPSPTQAQRTRWAGSFAAASIIFNECGIKEDKP